MDYNTKKTKDLIQILRRHFNAYIRYRDRNEPCINCGKYRKLQAGHYFPVGKYPNLRFNLDNVHGECKQCNYFNSQSHAYKYRNNLIKKIGEKRFEHLEFLAQTYKPPMKYDRFVLIELIEMFKNLAKNLAKNE